MVNHLDLPPDVIDIIHFYLEGYYQGRKCASELLMPHFQRALKSISKKRWGVSKEARGSTSEPRLCENHSPSLQRIRAMRDAG